VPLRSNSGITGPPSNTAIERRAGKSAARELPSSEKAAEVSTSVEVGTWMEGAIEARGHAGLPLTEFLVPER